MAKYFKLADDNREIIENAFSETGMDNFFDLILRGVKKSKQLIKLQKASAIMEDLGNLREDSNVVLYLYEEAFDRLTDDMKKLLVEDALATLSFDAEKGKIYIGAPSIVVTCGCRAKYGDTLLDAAEAGVMAIQQIEAEKKQGGDE